MFQPAEETEQPASSPIRALARSRRISLSHRTICPACHSASCGSRPAWPTLLHAACASCWTEKCSIIHARDRHLPDENQLFDAGIPCVWATEPSPPTISACDLHPGRDGLSRIRPRAGSYGGLGDVAHPARRAHGKPVRRRRRAGQQDRRRVSPFRSVESSRQFQLTSTSMQKPDIPPSLRA